MTTQPTIEVLFNKMGAFPLVNEKEALILTPVQMGGTGAVAVLAYMEGEGNRAFFLDSFDCTEIGEEILAVNQKVRADNYYMLLMTNGMSLTFYLRTEGDIKLTWSLDWEVDELVGTTQEFEFVLDPTQWQQFEKVFADD